MDETQQYSASEMERMMKVQDVQLKATAKKITWWAAAEIIGVSDRTMRRWRERMEEGAPHRAELYLGTESAAGGRAGGQAAHARAAPTPAPAAAHGWNVVAY